MDEQDVVSPRRQRIRIVAAVLVGFLVGTTGLASAGALPGGAQEVAHHTLGAVGVSVPHGDRYQGPECGGVVKNHGQYVKSQPKGDRATAAASRCGKPIHAGSGDDGDEPDGPAGKSTGSCHGPPPWAGKGHSKGKGKPDAAAKAARKQACGHDDADEDENDDQEHPAPAPAAGAQPDTTLPTETSTTTTTATSTTSSTTSSTTTTTLPTVSTVTTATTLPTPTTATTALGGVTTP